MFHLPEDLLVSLFGCWTDARDLCKINMCSEKSTKCLESLYVRPGFVLKPSRHLSDACLLWLESKQIKVKLLDEYMNHPAGDQEWYQNGKLHRDNDLPAIIWINGDQGWYQHGKCHRDNDLPAYIGANKNQAWYQNGVLHRDNNLPAIIFANGDKVWYRRGIYGRYL